MSSPEIPEPSGLKWLRRSVLALTVSLTGMVLAVGAVIVIQVARFDPTARPPALPEGVALAEGERVVALTAGEGWTGLVVQAGDATHLRIYRGDRLHQEVALDLP